MEAKAVDETGIFRIFAACPNDPKTLILDVRPHKAYKKAHINQAYCVRLSSNGKVLADYSQSSYSLPWSQHCWWGKPVVVYGPSGLGRDHPVVQFLTAEARCSSVHYYKPGFDAFEAKMPFLCTPSVKANSMKKYPSVILPGFLYLGDWGHAEHEERLREINIKRIVTVHNHPDNLKVPAGVQHLKVTLADVEGADISPHFNAVYEFIANAERLKQPVLVHCGAGVSRSACMVMMYLMRSKMWSAQQARDHCIAARRLVCPNDGFWRVLCALEGPLGILNKSDPNATMGFAGADAAAGADVKLDQQAAGQPVAVRMVTAKELKQQQAAREAAAAAAAKAAELAAAAAAASAAADVHQPGLRRGRSRSRSSSRSSSSSGGSSSSSESPTRSRSRSRRLDKPRHRSSSRDRARDAAEGRTGRRGSRSRSFSSSRSCSRDRGQHRRHRSRSRSRSREHKRARRLLPAPAAAADADADAAAAAAAADAAAAAAAAAAAGVSVGGGEQRPGWLVTLEVSKPEGLVGQLLLGPMSIHQRVVVGRAPSCSVVLEHLSVSRQHAQLSVDLAGTVNVLDMGAAHGTKLNDAWIKPQQPRELPVGGVLKFGASTRVYKLLSVEKV